MQKIVDNSLLLPLGPNVRLLASNPFGLIALEKPEGILSHPNDGKTHKKALLLAPYDEKEEAYYVSQSENIHKVYLLHRLDSPTSGIVILATNEKAAAHVKKAFKENQIKKTYFALVYGHPPKIPKLWVDRLETQRTAHQTLRTQKNTYSGISSETLQTCLKVNSSKTLSLLELKPLTGRTHQLRVQCALHKVPIAGDKTYGNFAQNRLFEKQTQYKRLFLHAGKIEIPLAKPGLFFKAISPTPESFSEALHFNLNHPSTPHAKASPKKNKA